MKYTKEDEELFEWKSEYLLKDTIYNISELNIYQYFDFVFKRDNISMQEAGEDHYYDKNYNALILCLNKNKDKITTKTYIINKDLENIKCAMGIDMAITAPITYVGKKRNAISARFLYGFVVDLDGVGEYQIKHVIHQMKTGYRPLANLIVNSGHGLHLYYLLDKPIALYQNIQVILNEFKHILTTALWNSYTSYDENVQYQNILQGFRVPGSLTKFGKVVRVFKINDRPLWNFVELVKSIGKDPKGNYVLTPEQINEVLQVYGVGIDENKKRKEDRKESERLKKCKELYPGWYEKRIIKKLPKGRYVLSPNIYKWWLEILSNDTKDKVKVGHRYNCILILVYFANNSRIPFEQVEKDAKNLVDKFDEISYDSNRFTLNDIKDALKIYYNKDVKLSRKNVEYLSGIRVDPQKRNFRKQALHLKMARSNRDIICEVNGKSDWREGNGRPKGSVITADNSKHAKQIQKWRLDNPKGNKSQCARDLGMSRPTIIKWWDS